MKRKSYLTIGASVVVASGGLLFGYDMGIISGALLQLQNEFNLSCLEQELIVSSLLFGAVLSSLCGGAVIDAIGRKYTMIANCIVFVIGALILSLASSLALLISGRVVVGVAVGLSVVTECAYIAEISSPGHRGKLVFLTEVAIAVGFLIAYLVNYLCILMLQGWRLMFGLSGILALLQCLALFFIPKSPRFLVIKERQTEALEVLKRLRCDEDIAVEELSVLQRSLSLEKSCGWRQLFSLKDNMHYRLIIGLGLVFFQQASGLPSVLYYTPVMLKNVGFSSNQSATLATIGAGLTKAVAVCVALVLVDKVGRKKLLISGALIMAVCLFSMAGLNSNRTIYAGESCDADHSPQATGNLTDTGVVFTTVQNLPENTTFSTLSLICMLCYVASYSIGYGPVTWLVLSEIFPSAIKGRSVALVGAANWSFNLLVSFTFLDYLDNTGIMWTFVTYGIGCSIGAIFIQLFVPETKGINLEDINKSLNSLSIGSELKHQVMKMCCCEQSRRGRSSYEPLTHGISLAPITSSVSSLESGDSRQVL